MSLPLVAVVGRPNVGKSTFVNRIAQADDAIVHEMRGVTRDRSYHETEWNGVRFALVDTGGIEMGDDDEFQASITHQAFTAANEADVIVLIIDGRTGINADDEEVARMLRRNSKPVFAVVNKMDNPEKMHEVWEFYQLGLGDPWPVSSLHGNGTGDLLDAVVDALRAQGYPHDEAEEEAGINVAIIGRPNAGKSSLTNRLTNNDRSIVSNVAGTTRDAIDTVVEHDGKRYTIVDTAGLRRKSQIDEDVEYYGFVRAMRAIDRADVALLVIDGTLGVTDQDQRVAGFAAERGCAMVIVLNKWDVVDTERKMEVREEVEEKLIHVKYAPVIAVSALTGKSVVKIWDTIDQAYANFTKTIPTNQLNVWLQDIREFGHTVTKGKAVLRMKYMTQTGNCPPVFTLFVNRPDLIEPNFERYLENRLRAKFDLSGTPIRFKFKKKD